jgi:hypothetical protein
VYFILTPHVRETTDGVLDWRLDLLNTYTHNSLLQVIIMLQLISTIYKSPKHTLSLFQPAVISCFPAMTLTVEILQPQCLQLSTNSQLTLNYCHSHLSSLTTDSVAPFVSLITSRHGLHRKHRILSYSIVSVGTCLRHPAAPVYPRLLRNCWHYPATGLHATSLPP